MNPLWNSWISKRMKPTLYNTKVLTVFNQTYLNWLIYFQTYKSSHTKLLTRNISQNNEISRNFDSPRNYQVREQIHRKTRFTFTIDIEVYDIMFTRNKIFNYHVEIRSTHTWRVDILPKGCFWYSTRSM